MRRKQNGLEGRYLFISPSNVKVVRENVWSLEHTGISKVGAPAKVAVQGMGVETG